MLGPDARVAVIPPYILIYDFAETNDAVILLRICTRDERSRGNSFAVAADKFAPASANGKPPQLLIYSNRMLTLP